jgi:membrane associated rhomboid family serine protease
MSPIDSQIARLKRQRRSMMEFVEWKPSPFYYLYVPLGTALVYFLTGPPWWGTGKLIATGICFGLLGYLPFLSNRLRFWLFFRWPNKRLHRRIAALEVQLGHGCDPDRRNA